MTHHYAGRTSRYWRWVVHSIIQVGGGAATTLAEPWVGEVQLHSVKGGGTWLKNNGTQVVASSGQHFETQLEASSGNPVFLAPVSAFVWQLDDSDCGVPHFLSL